jgi:translation initiation factor 3 subunit J
MQARELEADFAHAEDLFGAVGIGAGSGREPKKAAIVDPKDPTKAIDLASLGIFRPAAKGQFDTLREVLVPLVSQNVKKAHYSGFLQELVKGFAKDMTSDQIRLVSSKLTILANEKQKEEKDAQKGGKKKAVPKKAGLAAAGKSMGEVDTRSYDDYDD